MSWSIASAREELRTLLSDGPTDRIVYRKKVFGEIGTGNLRFRTFEFRRVTDFTTAVAPLGVWKNGSLLSAVSISADFPDTGDFVLANTVVLADGDILEASYYVQWFIDSEVDEFMKGSTQWLGMGPDPTNIPDGLQPSALKYGAAEAYQKLAIRWTLHTSETFRLEDSPDGVQVNNAQKFTDMAKYFRSEALKLRDEYWTRQGQYLQPLFHSNVGRVRDIPPRV